MGQKLRHGEGIVNLIKTALDKMDRKTRIAMTMKKNYTQKWYWYRFIYQELIKWRLIRHLICVLNEENSFKWSPQKPILNLFMLLWELTKNIIATANVQHTQNKNFPWKRLRNSFVTKLTDCMPTTSLYCCKLFPIFTSLYALLIIKV